MLHPPKRISSSEGLGVNTTKSLKYISENLAIGTEVWGDMEKPWAQDEAIIALPGYTWRTRWEVGKPYIITKFFDDRDKLVAIYCDICRSVEKTAQGFAFDDLYLDIWQIPGSKPILLDEDELEEAVAVGHISTDEAAGAISTANNLIQTLQNTNILGF